MKSALWDVYCNFCASRQLIFKKAGYELSSMTKVNSTKEKSPASYCRFTIAELGDSSGRLLMSFVSGSKASIFVRKTLQIRPRDRVGRLAAPAQARREGPAFFDEDDACCLFRS